MTPTERARARNAEHMERVRAVHRRSAYERVLAKIAHIEEQDRLAGAGLQPRLTDFQVDLRKYLYELLEAIRREMVEAGQIAG